MLRPNRCPNPAIHYIGGCLENITFENELPQYLQTSSLVGEHSDFSTHLSGPAQELLAGLLDIRAWKRFSSDQIETIKKHQFFSHVNWHVSRNRDMGAYIPSSCAALIVHLPHVGARAPPPRQARASDLTRSSDCAL